MLGLSIPSVAYRNPASLAARVADLFRNGEQAIWFDPSDLSTLYQDAAGTTPVTAMEQPVGLMLDKSGRGNHCTFKAGTGRPVLSARYNRALYTEDFSNTTVWSNTTSGTGSTPVRTQNAGTSPNGAATATRIQLALNGGTTINDFSGFSTATTHTGAWVVGESVNVSVWVKTNDASTKQIRFDANGFSGGVFTVTGSWTKISFSFVADVTTRTAFTMRLRGSQGTSDSADLLVWGAEIRTANDGIGLPAYQRVVDSATYDTAGFPPYLRADGTDDGGSTNSIDFTGTDKITVFAGVRKLSDAAFAILCELGTTLNNNGGFYISAPDSAATNYRVATRGTVAIAGQTLSPFTSPTTNLIGARFDNAGSGTGSSAQVRPRINGVDTAASSGTTAGNYANAPIYMFSRASISAPFNGRLYGLIVLGRAATATEIANTERYLNMKGRLY